MRYIVVELKVDRLTGGDVGQLGTYVARRMTGCAGPGVHAPILGQATRVFWPADKFLQSPVGLSHLDPFKVAEVQKAEDSLITEGLPKRSAWQSLADITPAGELLDRSGRSAMDPAPPRSGNCSRRVRSVWLR